MDSYAWPRVRTTQLVRDKYATEEWMITDAVRTHPAAAVAVAAVAVVVVVADGDLP